MISVGLTGNMASGKSTIAEIWARAGVSVVSADELARRAVEPDTPGLREVVGRFGEEVLTADGTLDRAVLRDRVFRDEEARRELERILHPRIAVLRDRWLNERYGAGAALTVSEVPLLFEAELAGEFDVTVFVDAPEETRLRRALENRAMGEAEARRIMAAQMAPEEKRKRADYRIVNDGSLDELRERALEVISRIRTDRDLAFGSAEGWMRLDIHLHTRASFDCLSDPDDIIEAARERGVDRIAITDHNELALALEMHARYPERVIPGEEVKTAEGIDVIGYYLKEVIPRGTPAREVVERVKEQGGVSYLPHPYASGKGGGGRYAEELAALVDVVEVFNARLHPGALNEPAEELAARHGKPRGAGSDAHTVREVAGAWVEVPRHENEPAAFLEALGRSRVRGVTTPWSVHLASTWAKIRKKLP